MTPNHQAIGKIFWCSTAIFASIWLNSCYLNTITSIYFILYSPTYRWTDSSAPIFALFMSTPLILSLLTSPVHIKPYNFEVSISNLNEIQSGYYIQAWIVYTFCYFASVSILTVILPRYTLNQFEQPSDQIIQSQSSEKCGFVVYMEKSSPQDELMHKLKTMGDAPADEIWPDLLHLIRSSKYMSSNKDAVDILLENVDTNPKFKQFVQKISTLPKWFDINQFNNAQKLHQRYSILFGYVLGICTLVGGFGCPQINKVLISSRYWARNNDAKSLKNTLNRLRETAVWLFSVMRDHNSLKPFGVAWKSILRVRLFHCKIRYQLSTHKESIKYIYNNNEIVPINQAHLIGTLLGFQYNPLVVLSHVIGLPISIKDKNEYTHLWRYIGWVLGIIDDENIKCVPLKTFDISRAWMAKIWQDLINPDTDLGTESTTLQLSDHVLRSIAMSVSQRTVGKIFSLNGQTVEAMFRAFLTEEYADMISLAAIHWSYELQIRVIITIARIYHIAMYLFGMNWLNTFLWKLLWVRVMKHLCVEVLEKQEKYRCRFTKYCAFASVNK